jgi:hypothetical protein
VLCAPVVVEGHTDFADARGEVGVGEETVPPHAVEQFAVRHDAVAILDEECEEVEGLRLERHAAAGMCQLTAGDVDGELTCPVHGGQYPSPAHGRRAGGRDAEPVRAAPITR